ncbi:MAG: alpha-glucan family phosphorylase [bacterium]|nr:alpha-glucan family phosphorylase [bacterium]
MNHEQFHEYERFVQQFKSITSNLWYTWDPEAQRLVDVLLNKTNHELSSYQRFQDLNEDNKQELFANNHLRASVDHVYRKMEDYLSNTTWFDSLLQKYPEYEILAKNPIAYFCAEYGFTDWLRIYSGGLGILAADMLKEASDIGLPMVAVGLFYQYGFFKQIIGDSGYQTEEYIAMDPSKLPLELIRISTGAPLLIEITVVDHPVYCRIWTAQIGRVPLFLLDTNIPENVRMEDKLITGHLYGGDQDTRIRQELILGIGGERALSALGYHPTIFSMNEGHSAFAALEITKHFMYERGLSFTRAREETKTKIIYTNHTIVPAGNDVFDYDLVNKYLSPHLIGMGIDFQELYKLGNGSGPDGNRITDAFSMADLAFEMSVRANAVSREHGDAAKKMWPTRDITPITNGVHLPTWVAPRMQKVYEQQISPDWQYSIEDDLLWQNALHIPDSELWDAHSYLKHEMISKLNEDYGYSLSPDYLTITWARRFATYKRPDMVLENIERLLALVSNDSRPVQIIVSGKAHPKDSDGKNMMSRIYMLMKDERFKHRLVFVPNYQISVARHLVAGSDVWLNTPYVMTEASGTSGMKSAANGVLQCSTHSGWVLEVDWKEKGFMIEGDNEGSKLYDLLEQQIVPLYYDRNEQHLPEKWLGYMKRTIATICPEFSTKRTLKEYFEKLYTTALTKQH